MLRHKAIVLMLTAALTVPAWASSGSSGPSKPEDSGKPDDRNQKASNNSGPSKPEDNGKPDDRKQGSSQGTSSNSGPSKPEDSGKPDDRKPNNVPAANSSAGPDNAARHSLMTTSAGQSVRASGFWETRVRGDRERFKVEIDANMPDGATFLVLVNSLAAGSIVLKLHEGELELDTNDNKVLPEGVRPVGAIRSVQVLAPDGTVILEGRP